MEQDRTTRLQGWQEKNRGKVKLILILISQVNGSMERMILREQESVFLPECGLIVLVVLKCLFLSSY